MTSNRRRSNLTAAERSPTKAGEDPGELNDHLGWATYGNDWRNFFECMLAPVAQQAAGAQFTGFLCFACTFT